MRLVKPFFLIALGLLFGILSSLIAVILGHELFMQGVWISIPLMGDGVLKIGHTLAF